MTQVLDVALACEHDAAAAFLPREVLDDVLIERSKTLSASMHADAVAADEPLREPERLRDSARPAPGSA